MHSGGRLRAMSSLSAVVIIAVSAVLAIAGMEIFHPQADHLSLDTQIIGFALTLSASVLAYMKAQDTHTVVNGRMEEFKQTLERASLVREDSARAQGVTEGRSDANARTDALASHRDV